MSNDTSDLYSGLNSQSFVKQEEKKDVSKKQKALKRSELQPKADIVLDEIAKEKKDIPNKIWKLTTGESSEESVRAVLGALKLYDTYLDTLSSRLKNVLRVKDE